MVLVCRSSTKSAGSLPESESEIVDRLSEAGYDEPEPKYLWNRKSKNSPASP